MGPYFIRMETNQKFFRENINKNDSFISSDLLIVFFFVVSDLKGQLHNGKRDGRGKMIYKDGTSWEGNWYKYEKEYAI